MVGSNANLPVTKIDTSLEGTCSASSIERRERSRRVVKAYTDENPKCCLKISRNEYSIKGLRTPTFPSVPKILDLQQKVVLAGNARCGQGKPDQPRPPASIDGHTEGPYNWLMRNTEEYTALVWLVQ